MAVQDDVRLRIGRDSSSYTLASVRWEMLDDEQCKEYVQVEAGQGFGELQRREMK